MEKDFYRVSKYTDWIFDHIPYGWRIHNKYRDTKLWFKSGYQKLTKGYADQETWSLDYYTAKWILPRLKHLRNHIHGVPFKKQKEFPENTPMDNRTLTPKEWEECLDKMIFAFDYVANEEKYTDLCYPADYQWGFIRDKNGIIPKDKDGKPIYKQKDDRKPNYIKLEEFEKRYSEGIKLFSIYYRDLWT